MLLYDGECGVCVRWAGRIADRLPRGYRVLAWQEHPDLEAVGLDRERAASRVWWIDVTGEPRGGAEAVAAAFVAIGGWLGLLGRLMGVPPASWIASAAYALVNRLAHLDRRSGACRHPG